MRNKRNICVITSVHKFIDQRIFNREAITLLNNGYSIDLIAPTDTQDFEYQGINVIGIPILPKRLRFINWFRILYKCFSGKYAVFHFHDPDLLFVGVILKIFTNSRVVYDVHEHYPDRLFIKASRVPRIFRIIASLIVKYIENICARIIKNVIVVEDSQLKRFKDINCNVIILYNFARVSSFKNYETGDEFYNKNSIVHTGTLSEARGSLLFIDIIKQIKKTSLKTKWYFVYRFYSAIEEASLLTKIEENNLKNDVKFVQPVPVSEIYKVLEKGDIAISILKPVGQYLKAIPTKIFEYMAYGLPIIAEDSPYNRKYIRDNNCGILVRYDDIDGYVSAISKIVNDRNYKMKLGRNGREAFLKYYNWEIQESRLIDFYNKLLSKVR